MKNRKTVSRERGAREIPDGPVDSWPIETLEFLRAMDPGKFERLCQRLLREAGFERVHVTNNVNSPDGGIDGFGELRINHVLTFKVLFQCKRYSNRNWVTAGQVRDFRGAMHGRAEKGLFITTNWFSREAQHEAVREGVLNIELIDGRELCELLKKFNLGIKTQEVGVLEREFFDSI